MSQNYDLWPIEMEWLKIAYPDHSFSLPTPLLETLYSDVLTYGPHAEAVLELMELAVWLKDTHHYVLFKDLVSHPGFNLLKKFWGNRISSDNGYSPQAYNAIYNLTRLGKLPEEDVNANIAFKTALFLVAGKEIFAGARVGNFLYEQNQASVILCEYLGHVGKRFNCADRIPSLWLATS